MSPCRRRCPPDLQVEVPTAGCFTRQSGSTPGIAHGRLVGATGHAVLVRGPRVAVRLLRGPPCLLILVERYPHLRRIVISLHLHLFRPLAPPVRRQREEADVIQPRRLEHERVHVVPRTVFASTVVGRRVCAPRPDPPRGVAEAMGGGGAKLDVVLLAERCVLGSTHLDLRRRRLLGAIQRRSDARRDAVADIFAQDHPLAGGVVSAVLPVAVAAGGLRICQSPVAAGFAGDLVIRHAAPRARVRSPSSSVMVGASPPASQSVHACQLPKEM